MRIVFAALLVSIATAATPAQADPYHWCGVFGGGGAAVTNCYFKTIEQCQASMSGNGGYCRPNGFYDGRPVSTAGDGVLRPRREPR